MNKLHSHSIDFRKENMKEAVDKGNEHIHRGLYNEAIVEFTKAIKNNPRCGDAYYGRGFAYQHKGNFYKAVANYNNAMITYSRKEDKAKAIYARGVLYSRLGICDRSWWDLHKAEEWGYKVDAQLRADLLKAIGKTEWFQSAEEKLLDAIFGGDFDKKIDYCNKAIELDPNDARAYEERGDVCRTKGLIDQAIADFTKVIELIPKYLDLDNKISDSEKKKLGKTISDTRYAYAYLNRGRAYCKNGKFDEAISDFTKAIEIYPSLDAAYRERGIARRYRKDFDQAVADFTKIIESNTKEGSDKPIHAEAYLDRGIAYREKGELDKAISDFNKALEINPDFFCNIYIERGLAYYLKGEYDKARDDMHKAETSKVGVIPKMLVNLKEMLNQKASA